MVCLDAGKGFLSVDGLLDGARYAASRTDEGEGRDAYLIGWIAGMLDKVGTDSEKEEFARCMGL